MPTKTDVKGKTDTDRCKETETDRGRCKKTETNIDRRKERRSIQTVVHRPRQSEIKRPKKTGQKETRANTDRRKKDETRTE